MKIVGDDYDLDVFKRGTIQLTIEDVIVLRDTAGVGKNVMCRLALALLALRSKLILFPSCLRHQFAQFEGSDNFDIVTMMHFLTVNKDDSKSKLLPFTHTKHPWKLLAAMTDKSHLDGSFQSSQTWMNPLFKSKIVLAYNIDKGGNDVTVSIGLLNRKGGNSMKHTYPIASVGGPVAESYEIEKETIFNDIYPIRRTIQAWVYDASFMLTVMVKSNTKQCQSIMFNPIPMKGICERRTIEAILKLDNTTGRWHSVKECHVKFLEDV